MFLNEKTSFPIQGQHVLTMFWMRISSSCYIYVAISRRKSDAVSSSVQSSLVLLFLISEDAAVTTILCFILPRHHVQQTPLSLMIFFFDSITIQPRKSIFVNLTHLICHENLTTTLICFFRQRAVACFRCNWVWVRMRVGIYRNIIMRNRMRILRLMRE